MNCIHVGINILLTLLCLGNFFIKRMCILRCLTCLLFGLLNVTFLECLSACIFGKSMLPGFFSKSTTQPPSHKRQMTHSLRESLALPDFFFFCHCHFLYLCLVIFFFILLGIKLSLLFLKKCPW